MAWDILFKTDRPVREVDLRNALELLPDEFKLINNRPVRTIWGYQMIVDVIFDDIDGEVIVSGEEADTEIGAALATRLAAELRDMRYQVQFDDYQSSLLSRQT